MSSLPVGTPDAHSLLGVLYLEGYDGVPPNKTAAHEAFQRAADAGVRTWDCVLCCDCVVIVL